jgi:hypothetical protein
MPARDGATLVEVLVAIFVMAIGLLAILVLFPLGVYRMAQAIQDDRTANIAKSANASAVLWNVGQDLLVTGQYGNNVGGAGFPVFVDPIGNRSFIAPFSNQVGGTAISGPTVTWIPRTNLSFIANAPAAQRDQLCLRWFSFLDDIIFNTSGYADTTLGGGKFERDNRYSWAYVCQAPNMSVPTVVNLTTLVFNRRPLVLSSAALSPAEYSYNATFNTSNNIITVTYGAGNPAPPVRPGEWIMDATPLPGYTPPPPIASARGNFYRIVGVNDLGGSIEYEVQQPLIDSPAPTGTPNRTIIVFEGLAEVFAQGPLRIEGQ